MRVMNATAFGTPAKRGTADAVLAETTRRDTSNRIAVEHLVYDYEEGYQQQDRRETFVMYGCNVGSCQVAQM